MHMNRTLLMWLASTIVVMILIVWITVSIVPLRDVRSNPDFYAAVSGLLGVAFGTAAAVAGAVATVRLAALALDVSRRQDERDGRAFVEERLQRAIDVLGRIGIELASVIASGLEVHTRLTEDLKARGLTADAVAQQLDTPVEGDLLASVEGFRDALGRLRTVLRELQVNAIARRCFTQRLREAHSATRILSEQSARRNFLKSDFFSSDPATISQVIDLAIRRLENPKLGQLLQAQLEAWLPNTLKHAKAYDHNALRSLAFTGNLLFSITETEFQLHMAVGLGILYDLSKGLPTSDIIRTVLLQSYHEGGIKRAVERTIIEFDPSEILGGNVTFALDELSGRLEILVLDLPWST